MRKTTIEAFTGNLTYPSHFLGNALTCGQCYYTSDSPKEEQKCDPKKVVNCTTSHCFTTTYILHHGRIIVHRDCDRLFNYCPDEEKTCAEQTAREKLQACTGICCQTDNCNNFTLTAMSSATDLKVTKFTLIVMVITGLFA